MQSKIASLFTSEEIEEISEERERYRASVIRGREFIGYDVLYGLISGRDKIEHLAREVLLESYAQLKYDYAIWSTTEWIDSSILKSALAKYRRLVYRELRSRT